MNPESLFALSEHLERLSKDGDPLEVLDVTVGFEYFRGRLVEGLGYGDRSKGGCPPFDPVSMLKVLIVQAQHNLRDAKMEFMIRDRWERPSSSRWHALATDRNPGVWLQISHQHRSALPGYPAGHGDRSRHARRTSVEALGQHGQPVTQGLG